jgi:hypothetical protein
VNPIQNSTIIERGLRLALPRILFEDHKELAEKGIDRKQIGNPWAGNGFHGSQVTSHGT